MTAFAGRAVFPQAWTDSNGTKRAGLSIAFYRRPTYTDGVTTQDSTTLGSASADFTSDDEGKVYVGQNFPTGTTIETYVDESTVEMSMPATASGTGRSFHIAGRQRSADLATVYVDRLKSQATSNPYVADAAGNTFPYLDPGDYDAVSVHGVTPFSVVPDHEDIETVVAGLPAEIAARIAADAALDAAKQPVDSDLTAIAALGTTAFGRGLLALADGAALAGSIPSGTYGETPDGEPAVALVTGGPAQTVTKAVTFSTAPAVPDDAFSQAKVSGLVPALAARRPDLQWFTDEAASATLGVGKTLPLDDSTFELVVVEIADPGIDSPTPFVLLDAASISQSMGSAIASVVPSVGGSGWTFSQADATRQPTLQELGAGGPRVIRFDSTNDALNTPVFGSPLAQPATLVFVARAQTMDAETRHLFDNQSGSGRWMFTSNGTTGKWNAAADVVLAGGDRDNALHLFILQYSTTTGRFWVDGEPENAIGNVSTRALTSMRLGANQSGEGARNWGGDVAYMAGWSGTLSATYRDALRRYFKLRYPTLNLSSVATIDSFRTAGYLRVGGQLVHYAGRTQGKFTGCRVVTGAGVVLPAGAVITQAQRDVTTAAHPASAISAVAAGVLTATNVQGQLDQIRGALPANHFAVVTHNADANVARPSATVVYWRGSADPVGRLPSDLWYDQDIA